MKYISKYFKEAGNVVPVVVEEKWAAANDAQKFQQVLRL